MASLQSSESEESQDDVTRFGDWIEEPLSETAQTQERCQSEIAEPWSASLPWLR